MYANFIFDLYGTLVDIHTNETKASLWKNMARYMTLQGARYEAGELRKAYRRLIQELSRTPEKDVEIDLAPVIRRLYTEKGVSPSEETVRYWALTFRTLSLEHLRLFQGADELLRELRRRERGVYLLSNAQRLFTEPEIRSLGIYDLFDDVFLSSEIGYKKPSPHFYNALLRKHALEPGTCVMVGNDWQADAWGAHNNGMASLYLRTPQSPRDEGELPPDCRRLECISDVLDFG